MIYKFLESIVTYVKGSIVTAFSCTPYKDKIEKPLYLALEHTTFFLGGYLAFWNRDWLYDVSMMWEYNFELSIYIYYFLYFIRYVIQINHLDKKDKDYHIFLVHHLMTLTLLGASCFRFIRIGVVIALSHDISDIFLNFAKVLNKVYEISRDTRHNTLSNLSLSFFAVSWIPTRILLNYNILKEIYTHKNMSINIFVYDCWIDEKISIILLFINFTLQMFWQVLILKFMYNIITGTLAQDEKGVKYKMS